ncbi:uncharacterized protein LOC111284377 [Durio zibethinus]|uniref:Uncharacterized protein LOC111284377 n=1 Tax=Durio zibethinus TaxID=66656 RepID=A0A6P5XLN2_DURZI|nr:uncharacterized protein LOC111284377 [Durio zibethinus]
MANNSKGKKSAYSGFIEVVPKQTTTYNYQSKQGGQSSFNQTTTKESYVDKQTGSYARATNREVVSTGETFKERSTGKVGYKDEYKTTSTYRVGDKSGYAEYQVEERFRNVDYYGSGSGNKGNKYLK